MRFPITRLVPFLLLLSIVLASPVRGQLLFINEFMAGNSDSVQDSHGQYDDWIEIYNAGPDAIDMAGMSLTDDLDDPAKWRIPAGDSSLTTIPGHGYLLVWADNDAGQGALHASFKLSRGGEALGLYNVQGGPIDTVTFGSQETDISYGRLPDGGMHWRAFGAATPGASNQTGAGHVLISEIMYHPHHSTYEAEDTNREWIELLNNGGEAVSLAGWRFSDGVYFTFPDVVLEPDAYLVVAADVNTFQAMHPEVPHVVGGWTDWLSNAGETLELVDEEGAAIDRVEYSDEGDWAQRELGPEDHGHRGWRWRDDHDGLGGSLELLDPSVPNDYGQNWAAGTEAGGTPGRTNSIHAIAGAPLILDVAHLPCVPHSDGPVTVTARLIAAEIDGLEVVLNYRVDGQADFTSVSMSDDGQHGEVAANDGVYGAAIPAQADEAVVEFYVEATDVSGYCRTWPAPALVDGISEQVTNALYLVDSSFDVTTPWEPGNHPVYYLIMRDRERTELEQISDRDYTGDLFTAEPMSDAQMNATFISIDGGEASVRYQAGVRNRGNRKRADPPMAYRVNFTNDRFWKGVGALNLNSKYPHLEVMGSILFQMAGLAAADVTVVRLKVNGDEPAQRDHGRTYGFYSAVEVLDADWAKNHFPDDDNGNLYRCTYYDDGVHSRTYADLDYKTPAGQTPDPNDYRLNYPKKTNEAADDWSDLLGLIDMLNSRDISDEDFLAEVSQIIHLEKWMRFLAVDALLGNREGGLTSGSGDDYAIYRGGVDPRFWLVPHDMDTLLGQGDHSYGPQQSIWGYVGVDGLRRLLNHPDVVQLYYRQCRDVAQTVLAPARFDALAERVLGDWVPDSELNGSHGIKQFVRDRANSILHGGYPDAETGPQIPQRFAVFGPEVVGEYAYTQESTAALNGSFNAIEMRSVRVNGVLVNDADWSQRHGTWSIAHVALHPGINRISVRAFAGPGGTGGELDRTHIDIYYDDGDTAAISGTLQADRTLDATSGPWRVPSSLIVPPSVTLAIEPGTTIFFDEAAGIIVQEGGRLVAEGTEYERIRLTRSPDGMTRWEGIQFDHTLEDNRLSFVDMAYGDGQGESIDVQHARAVMDHVTWSGTNTTVLNLDHPTVMVCNSTLPPVGDAEPVHGVGLAGDEELLFEGCIFGPATGYNDIIDFAGGQRPGPILQIYDSLFFGGGDDGPDLDGADAHIEGNIFMRFNRNQGGDSTSNAIATGRNGGDATVICVVRNLFVDNDYAVLVKEEGLLLAENNTFVNTSAAAISFGEPDRSPPRPAGEGAYLARNIFWDNAAVFAHYFEDAHPDYGPAELVIDDSILPATWHDLGVGNIDADPLFVGSSDFDLKPMSPARGASSCGLDRGAYVPPGASVYGEPGPWTHRTEAVLGVCGPGITHYRYSLNDPNGPWSQEQPVDVPIELTGLQDGRSYTVFVLGKNSAGRWQQQPNASRIWTVDLSYGRLMISEVLAVNETVYEHEGTYPDWIELHYDGPDALNLSGMSLTDDFERPKKFAFPAGTIMQPGDYLVLLADANTATSGIHVGFSLDGDGDEIYLYDAEGVLLDSLEFGHQLADLSVGRTGRDGLWRLTAPSPRAVNVAQPVGDPERVRINEWLARGHVLFAGDFIELYNPQAAPVDVGGFSLTDNPVTQPQEYVLRPLTFIASEGFGVFQADGQDLPGHANFKLSTDGEMIGLFAPGPREVDRVFYGPQTPDVSQGHAPDGMGKVDWFYLPTPGLANPVVAESTVTWTALAPESADKRAIIPLSADQVAVSWMSDPAFDDSAWLSVSGAPGGVGYERGSGYEDMIGLDVESQMYGQSASCYVRIPFALTDDAVASLDALMLSVRYDDGFVAYLNGVEVARANISGAPQWDSRASGNHEADDQGYDAAIDVSDFIGTLRAGANVLAIHSLNVSATSSDFVISAMLEAATVDLVGAEYPYLNELRLLEGLRIAELMYHAPEGNDLDFVELANISDVPLDLTGLRFTDGIEFVFPAMQLAPGQRTVVVADLDAFQSSYGPATLVAGQYAGRLSDNGEDIVLKLAEPLDAALMRFRYDDAWRPTTDGGGMSLVVEDLGAPVAQWNAPESWQASNPTPGQP